MRQDHFDPNELKVSANGAGIVATFAIGRGVPVEVVEEQLGVSYIELLGEVQTLRIKCLDGLWRMIDQYTDGPKTGVIDIADRMPVGFYTRLIEGIQYAATLREALAFASQYSHLIAEGLHLELDESAHYACLSLSHPSDSIIKGHANQSTLGLLWRLICAWTDQNITPQSVHFIHGENGSKNSYDDFFKTCVRFDNPIPHSTLIFDRSILDTPLPTADGFLFSMACADAKQRIQQMTSGVPDPSLMKLQRAITSNAANGIFDASAAAKNANMAARTAQRVAARHGTSMLDLVQTERARQARRLLTDDPEADIHDIALEMGYSDDRAFRRAFKRWTGVSPAEFKRLASRH